MKKLNNEAINALKERNISLPDNDQEIINLFFGLQIVEKLDYWIDRANDYIDNPKPKTPFFRPEGVQALKDKGYRDAFIQMNDEQKVQTKKLIRESVEGILFSTFLLFDQPPAGNWKMSIEDKDTKVLLTKYKELHEDYYKWINLFSTNIDNK